MPKRRDMRPTAHPGVYTTEGGHVVRVRVRDPRTGREVDRPRFVPGSLREALRVQAEMRAEVRERGRVQRTKLAAYARSWLARKRSALSVATLDRYAVALEDHILPVLLRVVASADVQKAITGHSSEAMRQHYAHIRVEERAAAIARVVDVVRLERR